MRYSQLKPTLEKSNVKNILRKGSAQKKEIQFLQQLLFELGFGDQLNWSKFGADGDYGNSTQAAVQAFARKVDLVSDGLSVDTRIGKELVRQYDLACYLPILRNVLEAGNPEAILKRQSGRPGPVIALQTLLYHYGFGDALQWSRFGADGDYGNATTNAVKAMAQREHLVSNGETVTKQILEKMVNDLTPQLKFPEFQPILRLGCYDQRVESDELKPLMERYHRDVNIANKSEVIRIGDLFDWGDFRPVSGSRVQQLQEFLVKAGIMHPDSNMDGIFAYATQAGVRVFQEYVRIYEGKKDMVPNGILDPATAMIMKEWQEQGKSAKNWPRGKQSEQYKNWLKMIESAKSKYAANPHKIIKKVNEAIDRLNSAGTKIDTIKVEDWTFSPDDIHLIGIRRNEDESGANRKNDDVFVLLVNGMVFKFWGSTDPNKGARSDEAFLSEGQHKFRFGWHNVSRDEKTYQGLEPFDRGVLVFRDRLSNDKLTDADIDAGLDKTPNTTINIHWTGIGDGDRRTWSEGCQVIAGKGYVDPLGKTQDCSPYAGVGTSDLKDNSELWMPKTKGAYNLFCDLLLLYRSNKHIDYLIYTLGRDENLLDESLVNLGGPGLLNELLAGLGLEPDEGLA